MPQIKLLINYFAIKAVKGDGWLSYIIPECYSKESPSIMMIPFMDDRAESPKRKIQSNSFPKF